VKSIPEVLEDSHMWEREVMMEADAHDPPGKKVLVPGPTIIKFSKTPTSAGPIPKYGEHNGAIYGDLLGMSQKEMAGLAEEGIIT
jgi:crotonobetainyl-CoA:carnitine CoA-transferase CaiB-like acyl-CoA transferase